MSMNPLMKSLLNSGSKNERKGMIDEIIVLSIGTDKSQETIRSGLAMGGDRGILVKTDNEH